MSTSVVSSSHVFEIRTKQNGRFRFDQKKPNNFWKKFKKNSSRKFKKAPSFIVVLKQGFKNLFRLHYQEEIISGIYKRLSI